MRVGVQLANEHTTVTSLQTAWTYVDQLEVDTLWVWDHLLPIHGDAAGSHFECWSLLAAIAATTRRVEIGPLVTCHAFRNPALLSTMAATVDHISGGRLVLGFGAGWFQRDFAELGLPFSQAGNRLRGLERTIREVRDRWERAAPRPRRRIPVLVGSGGRLGLSVVARHADIWNWFGPARAYAGKGLVLDAWCERVGRSPEEIERSVTLYDAAELSALDDYAEAGARHVIFGVRDPWDWDNVHRVSQWATNHRGRIPSGSRHR